MRYVTAVTLTLILALSGCATVPKCCGVHTQNGAVFEKREPLEFPPEYLEARNSLGTRIDYHTIAIDPGGVLESLSPHQDDEQLLTTLDMPIYLIGIEKVRGSGIPTHIDGDEDVCAGNGYRLENWYTKTDRMRKTVCSELSHPRPNVLTHIARFDGLQEGIYQSPCLMFSVYPGGNLCSGVDGSSDGLPYSYDKALNAIEGLEADLRRVVSARSPTHVLVLSTGWNTQQDESLFNYRDWLDGIAKAAAADQIEFRPLVVSFSWESGWDRFIRSFGAMTKGNDADEIGMTWANRIVNDVVRPIADAHGLPVVLVGHSYGTRVLGTSLVSAPLVEGRSVETLQKLVDLPVTFVALQPAFPLRRFHSSGKEPYFTGMHQRNVLMAMTSSRSDTANSFLDIFGAAYAGGALALDMIGKSEDAASFISLHGLAATGEPNDPLPLRGILLFDASEMVSCNMPHTGGGAHSDVFDDATGNYIWQVIRRGVAPRDHGVQ